MFMVLICNGDNMPVKRIKPKTPKPVGDSPVK